MADTTYSQSNEQPVNQNPENENVELYAEELAEQTDLANPAGFCTGGSASSSSTFSSVGSSASSVGTAGSISTAC